MSLQNPILFDLPMPIVTPRLTLRPLMPGDGECLYAAIAESFPLLNEWLPWAHTMPAVEQAEENARRFYADFILRKSCHLVILAQDRLIGMCDLNNMQWAVPSAGIGYWCRLAAQGQGYVTEAIAALARYAFEHIGVKRLTILCDAENKSSRALAERLSFTLETAALGIAWKPGDPNLRMGCRYVRFNTEGLPDLEVRW